MVLARAAPARSTIFPPLVVGMLLATPASGEWSPPRIGGPAAAQAGAHAARADGPSALVFNPAGLTDVLSRSEARWTTEVGASLVERSDRTVVFPGAALPLHVDASETSTRPSAFAAWSPGADSRWTLGVGFREALDHRVRLGPEDPWRYEVRRQETRIGEGLLGAGLRLSERLSIGATVRVAEARVEREQVVFFSAPLSGIFRGEAVHTAAADTLAVGADLGLRWEDSRWGAGLVVRSGIRFREDAATRAELLFVESLLPGEDPEPFGRAVVAFLDEAPVEMRFDLPPEVVAGAWTALGSRVRAEVDVIWRAWSETDGTTTTFSFTRQPQTIVVVPLGWEDVVASRAGLEWSVGPRWSLGAGIAYEPSPVPSDRADRAYPIGDAWELSAGVGVRFRRAALDVAAILREEDSSRLDVLLEQESRSTIVAVSLRVP